MLAGPSAKRPRLPDEGQALAIRGDGQGDDAFSIAGDVTGSAGVPLALAPQEGWERHDEGASIPGEAFAPYPHREAAGALPGAAGMERESSLGFDLDGSGQDSDAEEGEREGEGEEEQGFLEDILHTSDTEAWVRCQKAANVSPEDILSHLGLRLRHAGGPEEMWHLVAQVVAEFRRRLLPRERLAQPSTLDQAVALLGNARRIMVVSGAGISVAAGIPDFRSQHGVYQMVEEKFDLPDPQSLFDIDYFVHNPLPFFTFAKNLYPGKYSPTLSHKFIRALEDKGSLLRNYTQNIDTLEKEAGIHRKVTCHGSFETASCLACRRTVPCEHIRADVMQGNVPRCSACDHWLNVLKPDIVFFGEALGEGFEAHIRADLPECDLLLVMGSSMRVQPVATIPSMLAPNVPQILINRELVLRPHQFDLELLGDCDAVTAELARRLGFELAPDATGVEAGCGNDISAQAAPAAAAGPPAFEYVPPNRYLFPGAVPPTVRGPSDDADGGCDEAQGEDAGEEQGAGGEESPGVDTGCARAAAWPSASPAVDSGAAPPQLPLLDKAGSDEGAAAASAVGPPASPVPSRAGGATEAITGTSAPQAGGAHGAVTGTSAREAGGAGSSGGAQQDQEAMGHSDSAPGGAGASHAQAAETHAPHHTSAVPAPHEAGPAVDA
mmetsp:Transcript_13149/g.39702  ORF Transcript_13149/g.39702 Transcript_13149/m.39702 type:complete len:666 (+) Transcript_13149:113-2110(+)